MHDTSSSTSETSDAREFEALIRLTGYFLISQGLFAVALAQARPNLLKIGFSLTGLAIAFAWSFAAKARQHRVEDSLATRSVTILLPLFALIAWFVCFCAFTINALNEYESRRHFPVQDFEVISEEEYPE